MEQDVLVFPEALAEWRKAIFEPNNLSLELKKFNEVWPFCDNFWSKSAERETHQGLLKTEYYRCRWWRPQATTQGKDMRHRKIATAIECKAAIKIVFEGSAVTISNRSGYEHNHSMVEMDQKKRNSRLRSIAAQRAKGGSAAEVFKNLKGKGDTQAFDALCEAGGANMKLGDVHNSLRSQKLLNPEQPAVDPLTFRLPDFYPLVKVHLIEGLSQHQILSFPAFQTWLSTLKRSLSLQTTGNHESRRAANIYKLRSITIQAVDWFGSGEQKRLGCVKLQAGISNDNGESLPGVVFVRGGAAAVLLILQPDDIPREVEQDKHVLLTVQPRVATGSLRFAEIPAGMFDERGSFSGKAATKIKEETGLTIAAEHLIDMTALTLPHEGRLEERLQRGVYSSPDACDEFMPIFLCHKRIPRTELQRHLAFLTGLTGEKDKLALKVVRLADLWKEGSRDAKTLAALALYHGLRLEGKV